MRLAPALVFLALLAGPGTASAACPDADLIPLPTNLDRIEAATFCLHNEERTSNGLPPFGWSDQLAASAKGHSLDMVERLFFEHDAPAPLASTPHERIEASGYGPEWSGENIFYGYGAGFTPRDAVDAWMDSPGHRENILRPQFEHVGLGVAFGAPDEDAPVGLPGATYTANFGSRMAADDETIGVPPAAVPGSSPNEQPASRQPALGEPGAGEPGAGEPGAGEPGVGEPGLGVPDAAERDAGAGAHKPKAKKKLKRCLKKAKKAKKLKKKRKKRKRCKRLYR